MRRMHDQHSRRMSQNTHLAVPANGRRPLLISTSLALIDRVVRLASTAALEVQVAPDAASATRYWLDAPRAIGVLEGSRRQSLTKEPCEEA